MAVAANRKDRSGARGRNFERRIVLLGRIEDGDTRPFCWTIILVVVTARGLMGFAGVASVALILALGAVRGCTRGAAMIELEESAAGRPVTVAVGERLRVTLPENRTTGYRWQVGGDCSGILTQEEDQ